MDFYTFFKLHKSNLLISGYKDGKKVNEAIKLKPYLFLPTDEKTEYTTIHGENVVKKNFKDVWEARRFVKDYEDIENFRVYGMNNHEYVYINDNFDDIKTDMSLIRIGNYDIETDSEGGYADLETADKEITSITIHVMSDDTIYVFGYKDYRPDGTLQKEGVTKKVKYMFCRDEKELLTNFIILWQKLRMDVITGWNCLDGEEPIWMNKGIRKLKDVSVGDRLSNGNTVLNKMYTGEKMSYSIKLANGKRISSSRDHKFFVHSKPKDGWRNYDTLISSGEQVMTLAEIIAAMQTQHVYVKSEYTDRTCDVTSDIPDELMQLLGFIYTDGTWDKKGKSVSLYQKYISVLEGYKQICEDNFEFGSRYLGNISQRKVCTASPEYRYRFSEKHLRPYIHLIYDEDGNKRINLEELSKLSKRNIFSFITGMVDGDGFVLNTSIGICDYRNNVPVVAELLHLCGVYSTIHADQVKINIPFKDINEAFVTFVKETMFHPERKNRLNEVKFSEHLNGKNKKLRFAWENEKCLIRIDDIEEVGMVPMYDITTDNDHSFECRGVKTHNCLGYDHTYIIRRINRILGEGHAERLSPFGMIESREISEFGKPKTLYDIVGIPTLDYMECYKKFSFKNVESYKLDYISHLELNKKKLDYSEHKTLANLYKNDPSKFYSYNVVDVVRVMELEQKLKFIEQIFGIAHLAKINLVDSFRTVKPWDILIHNYLMKNKIVVPENKDSSDSVNLVGGFVKEVKKGHYKYVMSFDLTSLYPHLIMAFNMSPDTYFGKLSQYDNIGNIDRLVYENVYAEHKNDLETNNLCITPKGTLFNKDKQGFIPAIMKFLFEERKRYKNLMLAAKDKKEHTIDPDEKAQIERDIAAYHNRQLALKILLNGGYGALANAGFRWFDMNIAESVTMAGQYVIKSIEKSINEFLNKIMKTEGIDHIVAADTDSVYLNVSDIIDKVLGPDATKDEILEFLVKFSKEVEDKAIKRAFTGIYETCHIFEECLHMKLEAIGQAVWVAAKNYAMSVWFMEGVTYAKPEIKMTGISAVRSSTPEMCRKFIKDSLPHIIAKDEPKLKAFIEECEEEFYRSPFSKVAMPRGVTDVDKWVDPVKKYKSGVPYHVRGAITYNELVKSKGLENQLPLINNGDKMRLCYMKMPNPIRENILACPDDLPSEFGLEAYIDYSTQLEKTFLKAIESLVDAAGLSISNKVDLNMFYGD